MFTDAPIQPEEHKAWFHGLEQKQNAVYRIFELNGQSAGLVYFTEIDPNLHRCSWGFYLGEEPLPKGTGAQMCYLALALAFDEMALQVVEGESFAFNSAALAIHRKLGFASKTVLAGHALKHGTPQAVIRFELTKAQWETQKEALRQRLFGELARQGKSW